MMQKFVTVGENEIYGSSFTVPAAWNRVDFRFPQVGENYLSPSGVVECRGVSDKGPFGPRIIVVAKPPAPPLTESDIYTWTPAIPAGYEKVGFRPPVPGETFIAKVGQHVTTIHSPMRSLPEDSRIILKKKGEYAWSVKFVGGDQVDTTRVKIDGDTKVLICMGKAYGVAYWKEPQRGFTLDRREAGVYTLAEALKAAPHNTYELAGD